MGNSTSSFALLLVAGVAVAQDFPPPADTGDVLTGPQKVQGQVVRPGTSAMVPVPGIWVTLHRVGSDTAAPLDSVRADSRGGYEFSFTRTGDERAMYFVSASYAGVAYFTPPLVHSVVRGGEAEIAVFDTTSSHVPISVRGHHVIVSSVDANSVRRVTEVFEIANDSSVTRVAGEGDEGAVWFTDFPPGAAGMQVAQGDIPAAAVTFAGTRALVLAPLAPGLKQVAFSYVLPAAAFPLHFRVFRETPVFEVLIEDETGTVSGANLAEVAPVALGRRTFRRFLADDVSANEVSVMDLPAASVARDINPVFMIGLTVVIGATMVLALARALRSR